MKKIKLSPVFSFIFMAFLLFSCKDKVEETYTVLGPQYMSYEDLRKSVKVTDEQPIQQAGKIYFKDNHIFVNEYREGIHVIDNTDPANPQVIKFIEIPGNVDLAIKGNILYADSYIDLVALDISDLSNITEVKRIEEVFPYFIPHTENNFISEIDQEKGVVTGYTEKEETREIELNQNNYRMYEPWLMHAENIRFSTMGDASSASANNVGTGGSMARFTLVNDFLYTVDHSQLKLFNVAASENPIYHKNIPIGQDIETIFPYQNKLFIGSQTGIYIYNIANPDNPVYISEFQHARSCDPVVVQNNYAYATLRAGNACGNFESQLDVIDISNIENPQLVKEYAMEEPYGLGIDGSALFVCDGSAGLKIYDATDPEAIDQNLIAHYDSIDTYDVIPLGNILVMIGTDGLFQYDYSDLTNIQQLSFIPIYEDGQ